jgi:hypothetical protein
MSTDGPVLETLADMTVASVEHNSLTPREFMIARLAAMVAVDAPPISYFASASAVQESGMTTVAPVTGAPRVMSAGGHILRALGIAIAVAEAEMADEGSQL